jgi:DNA-binding LacI/PurR family transcriptional regulator
MQSINSQNLLNSLEDLIERSDHGTRLPTVRELMRQYGVGQTTVQDVFSLLKEKGQISAQVGRGSYVVKEGSGELTAARRSLNTTPSDSPRNILILSNSSMNERCARVQNAIIEQVKAKDGHVMQISYHDTDHLLDILKSIPSFDGTILQSHYEVIPVRLLAMLQAKTRALVVDGHTVSGVDVDRMGIDWEEALSLSLDHLVGNGRRRIALVSLDSSSQPILSVRRFFHRQRMWGPTPIETELVTLADLQHPTQNVTGAMHSALDDLTDHAGKLKVEALICVGISDGMGVAEVLRERALMQTNQLDVVLLGHIDVPTEHLDQFTISGGRYSDGANALVEIIENRLADPKLAPQIVYLDCEISVKSPTN